MGGVPAGCSSGHVADLGFSSSFILMIVCGDRCQSVVPVLGTVPNLARASLADSQFPLSTL